MLIENRINQKLNQFPIIKKTIKRAYQYGMYLISDKKLFEGEIRRLSPSGDDSEYFYGYYDKSPWSLDGKYIICMKAKDTWSNVAPKEEADILLLDTVNNNAPKKIASTRSWNVQQGCMAQWLGPDFNNHIIYNDFRDGHYCAVILDIYTGEEKQVPLPIYALSPQGEFALTLDFSRLHRLRPGYGYSNLPDETKNEKVPTGICIWKVDLNTNDVTGIISYQQLLEFETRPEMIGAEHKVNHIMISPNGKRFMFLHRWFKGQRKYSRLITSNVDGTDMYNLSDDNMVSHCYWKNDDEIIAFANKKQTGEGYYLMKDRTPEFVRLWSDITSDGHPSYSPDKKYIVIDTYPNRKRMASIKLMTEEGGKTLACVFAPFKYDNDTRCDLHPRWNRDGTKICFDTVFSGHRELYEIDLVAMKGDVNGE